MFTAIFSRGWPFFSYTMAYVPVPKDLSRVKSKIAFNLTKRQLVCFGGGALLGVPLFFLIKGPLGNSTAALCMILIMLPFFMLGVYEKNGQPLEKIAVKTSADKGYCPGPTVPFYPSFLPLRLPPRFAVALRVTACAFGWTM